MQIHAHDAAGEAARRNLTSAAYGQPLDLHYVLDDCDVVVSFDDDFLGPGPNQVRNARGWAASRTTVFGTSRVFACTAPKACRRRPGLSRAIG